MVIIGYWFIAVYCGYKFDANTKPPISQSSDKAIGCGKYMKCHKKTPLLKI